MTNTITQPGIIDFIGDTNKQQKKKKEKKIQVQAEHYHILKHKKSFNKYQRIQIIKYMFSDHNVIKLNVTLEIRNKSQTYH